jgi:hypothetical protein
MPVKDDTVPLPGDGQPGLPPSIGLVRTDCKVIAVVTPGADFPKDIFPDDFRRWVGELDCRSWYVREDGIDRLVLEAGKEQQEFVSSSRRTGVS